MDDDNPVVPLIRRMMGYGDAPKPPRKAKTRRKKRRKGTR